MRSLTLNPRWRRQRAEVLPRKSSRTWDTPRSEQCPITASMRLASSRTSSFSTRDSIARTLRHSSWAGSSRQPSPATLHANHVKDDVDDLGTMFAEPKRKKPFTSLPKKGLGLGAEMRSRFEMKPSQSTRRLCYRSVVEAVGGRARLSSIGTHWGGKWPPGRGGVTGIAPGSVFCGNGLELPLWLWVPQVLYNVQI